MSTVCTAATSEARPIEIEKNEMLEAVESLRRNVDLLLDGINPVLSPLSSPPNNPIIPDNPVPAASPMAETMREVTSNIRAITRKIVQHAERVEL